MINIIVTTRELATKRENQCNLFNIIYKFDFYYSNGHISYDNVEKIMIGGTKGTSLVARLVSTSSTGLIKGKWGAETWTLTKVTSDKLEAFEM